MSMTKEETRLRNDLAEALHITRAEVKLYGDNIFRVPYINIEENGNVNRVGSGVIEIVKEINTTFREKYGTTKTVAQGVSKDVGMQYENVTQEFVLQLNLEKHSDDIIKILDKKIGAPARKMEEEKAAKEAAEKKEMEDAKKEAGTFAEIIGVDAKNVTLFENTRNFFEIKTTRVKSIGNKIFKALDLDKNSEILSDDDEDKTKLYVDLREDTEEKLEKLEKAFHKKAIDPKKFLEKSYNPREL